jgi:hypothetical protein
VTRAGRWSLAWLVNAALTQVVVIHAMSNGEKGSALLFAVLAVIWAWLGGFAYGDPRTNATAARPLSGHQPTSEEKR